LKRRALVVVISLAAASPLAARQKPAPQPPRSQTPDIGRPTKPDDPLPTLDFAQYFVGRWSFEWDMPESPFGPAGRVTGTEVTTGLEGRFFESHYEGEGPQGRFNGRAVIIYNREAKTLARHETDSRGFSLLMTGTVGADLGGAFTIYYESAPFSYAGKLLRLKLTKTMTSPVFYRVRAQLATDGNTFINLGQPWWRKEVR
jgi:Protein of unknown function (DUF1579)